MRLEFWGGVAAGGNSYVAEHPQSKNWDPREKSGGWKSEHRTTLEISTLGLPWWCSSWESACWCRGPGFEPWSGKIPHATEQLSPCATTTEPARHNYWSPHAKSPCSTPGESTTMRSTRTAMKSSPRLRQLEKAFAQQRRPSAAKNKLN